MNSRNLLLQILMLDAGIVPDVENSSTTPPEDSFLSGYSGWHHKPKTLDELLTSLSSDEKKVVQRRFRKLWKKAAKRYSLDHKTVRSKSERRHLVKRMLLEDSGLK